MRKGHDGVLFCGLGQGIVFALLAVFFIIGVGCSSDGKLEEGLTLSLLKNCTYRVGTSTVRLQEGSLTVGQSINDYFYVGLADAALGDLNGDGKNDGAVILKNSGGGSGMFYELTAMLCEAGGKDSGAGRGGLRQTNSIELGDRVEILTLLLMRGRIIMEMKAHGPDDPSCCPSVKVKRFYILRDGELVETAGDT